MIKTGRLTWNEQYIPWDEEGGETYTMDNNTNNASNYCKLRAITYWEAQVRYFAKEAKAAQRRLTWAINHNRSWDDLEDRGDELAYLTWARNMAADFATYGKWKPDSVNWK